MAKRTAASGAGTPNEQSGSPLEVFADSSTPSRVPRVLMWTGLGLVICAGAYVGGQWSVADKTPSNASVVGLPIGGMSADEAVAVLDKGIAGLSAEPIAVIGGDKEGTLDPVAAGLEVDSAATVNGLTGFSLAPSHLWDNFFGGGPVTPVLRVDDVALTEQFKVLAVSLGLAPVDGGVVFTEGEANLTPAKNGQVLDVEAARSEILDGWLTTTGPIPLTMKPAAPLITEAKTAAAFAEAQQLVSAPISIAVAGQVAQLPAKTIGAASTYVLRNDDLVLQLDPKALKTAVIDRTIDLETKAKNARFEFKKGKPVIVGGKTGRSLDAAVVAKQVELVGTGNGERTAKVDLIKVEADESRKKLKGLGVNKVVAEFTTPLGASNAARVHNLILGSTRVTGSVILPNETWSLTDTLAPISAEGGYRSAGIVNNGVLTEGVGGGLSQMATTTYNVGFFAGLEDVEHRPHSYWFTRYPEGREATIYVGSIDMKFKNDTPYGIVMQAFVKDGSLTVRAWSTPHYRVETTTSARSNVQVPTTSRDTSGSCIAQPTGSPGFSVTVFRKVFLGDKLVRDEAKAWGYRPQNAIVCGSVPRPPQNNPKPSIEKPKPSTPSKPSKPKKKS